MDMDSLIGRPVMVVNPTGTYAGMLDSYDPATRHATLTRARVLGEWRAGHYYLDTATAPSHRELKVSCLSEGPVIIADVGLVAPLSDRAVKAICRASEDNLSILPPTE